MAETFAHVWEALTDTPEEAANMKARCELMLGIQERVKQWNLSQGEAAKKLGMTRPRLNELMSNRIYNFSLDALVNIATAAGYSLHIELAEVA